MALYLQRSFVSGEGSAKDAEADNSTEKDDQQNNSEFLVHRSVPYRLLVH